MSQRIWVIGAGQLGNMLQHAGMPLQLDVRPVDIETTETLELKADDIVTAEREAWPESQTTSQLAQHANFKNASVFGRLADRFTQKQLLDQLNISTAPWCAVGTSTQAETLYQQFGERVLLKSRRGGYDGRGQHWLKKKNEDAIPADWQNISIAEQAINFNDEISLVGVRDQKGFCYFYPLTLNLHVNGILMASIAPLPHLTSKKISALQTQAEQMLRSILNELNYVGVMAMECFRLDDRLLVNELAPRVHNSGHWTQAGASYSQFEAHLRAIAKLPLNPPVLRAPSVMINLIGTEYNAAWLETIGAQLFWYGKSVREGRKVGHINFCDSDAARLKNSLCTLEKALPKQYQEIIAWVLKQLSA